MTMTDNTTTTADADSGPATLVWEHVDGVEPAVWVGRVRGIFVGMIEARWQEGFTATSRLGRKLGTFGTLDDAEEAFIVTPAQRTPAQRRNR
jgi:hypothetical protein